MLKTGLLFAAVTAIALGFAGAGLTAAKAADYAVGGYGPYEDCDRCGPLTHDFGWRRPHQFERETVIERPAVIERPVIERRVVIERPAIVARPAVVIRRPVPRVALVPGYDCDC